MTERMLNMIGTVGDVVLLDTPTLHRDFFPLDKTGEACRRALRALTREKVFRSLPPVLCYTGARRGRLPTIYCLTPDGAEMFALLTGIHPKRLLRFPPAPGTLLHRLGFARDIHLVVNKACALAKVPRPQWILEKTPSQARRTTRLSINASSSMNCSRLVMPAK